MSNQGQHIDLLLKMLSIPAVSGEEGQRADLLEQYLRNAGIPVQRVKNNLLAGVAEKNSALKTVMLNSHIDTVPPSADWTIDPWTPRVENDKITGLGSNDAGASVIALIRAYEILKDTIAGQLNLMLVLSAEEEISGKNGLAALLPVLGDIDGAIIGEPTGMQPAVAERGLMVIDAEVKGRSGHAARNEGENAIYKAINDISGIMKLDFDKKSDWLPVPSAQVTMIESGKKHNVVPDTCRYVIDVRSNDQYSNRELLDMLQSVCSGTLIPRSMRLNASTLQEDHFLHRAIHHSGLEPFGSHTLSDMAVIPFPAIKMGPGHSARSHGADEYIMISEIEKGVEGYVNYIKTVINVLKERKHEVMG